ncbi:N-acetylmuramic acid 6-phosphate etherase [Alicyclobacillus pomorum]|uniref:N-acetylmuramic acid 6-phosphate etherase n=1 Tax=Alicyclobacillus pomorum TaxID=204470 RepID=UPI0004090292|nr:N-acetylmuramic acid 6-phosphate etherase [Alicyclobacillus pomorum]
MSDLDVIWTELLTEQPNPDTPDLDSFSALDIVTKMNEFDRSVPDAVGKVLPTVAQAINCIVDKLKEGGRLFYVGAGTSGRLGILDAAECPPTFNTPPDLVQAVIAGGTGAIFQALEHAEDHPEFGAADLRDGGVCGADVVVGIAASGRTPYVIGALQYARSVGAATISLACNVNARVSQYADIAIEVNTGPEILMGSTRLKAGTAQKLVLNMLSTGTMIRLGKVYRNLMVDVKATNEKLVERSKRIIMLATGVPYDVAARALSDAEGHVKLAIIMLQKQVDKPTARSLLDRADGFLRKALQADAHPREV